MKLGLIFALALAACGSSTPTPVVVADVVRIDQDACRLLEDLGTTVRVLCPFGDGSQTAKVEVSKIAYYTRGPIFIGCPQTDAGATDGQ